MIVDARYRSIDSKQGIGGDYLGVESYDGRKFKEEYEHYYRVVPAITQTIKERQEERARRERKARVIAKKSLVSQRCNLS